MSHAILLGRGRSGTTWISQILNRFSGCHYKDEPFNPGKSRVYSEWLANLGEIPPLEARAAFEALSRTCVHDVDYPPFLPGKTYRRQSPLLLRATWQMGQVLPALRGVYHWYGKPQLSKGSWVLTKQVNFPNEKLAALAEALQPKLIAVLRGPYASVSSALRFYAKTPDKPFRPDHSLTRVAQLTEQLAGELPDLRPYSESELKDMPEAAFEALRWRIQTEPLARFAKQHDQGMVTTHESFASDALQATKDIFAFIGWPLDEKVIEFVRTTTTGDKHKAFASEKKKQHGIHRDPVEAVQRWRKDLSEQQVSEIAEIVRSSELLDYWPDQVADLQP